MKIIARGVLLGLAVLVAAIPGDVEKSALESCMLRVEQRADVARPLGVFAIDEFTRDSILFSIAEGDVSRPGAGSPKAALTTSRIYEVRGKSGEPYFMSFQDHYFNHKGNRRSLLTAVQWRDGVRPKRAGTYSIAESAGERRQDGTFELATVGDSITYWEDGRFLRCTLRSRRPDIRFVGTRIDVFGFPHDGIGGDTTDGVLKRLDSLPISANTFLLIGTNDRIATEQTATNVATIALRLVARSPGSRVFVSTLLPRNDEFESRNRDVNAALRTWHSSCGAECGRIVLIDSEEAMIRTGRWKAMLRPTPDDLHPNRRGYRFLAELLADELR